MDSKIVELLKKKREEKGLSIEDVAKATKIQPSVLRDIEDDSAEEKLGPVYTKSFLKLYAKFLGVDLSLINKEDSGLSQRPIEDTAIRESKITKEIKKPLVSKISLRLSKFNLIDQSLFKLIGISAVVLIVVIAIFSIKKPAPASLKEIKSQAIKEYAKTAAVVKSSKTKSTAKKVASRPKRIVEKLILSIRAKEDSWLQVKSDSKVVFQRVLSKGSVEKWEAKEKLELWVGNAAGLAMELNGEKIGPFGRRGQVVKNIVMTKEGVTVGK